MVVVIDRISHKHPVLDEWQNEVLDQCEPFIHDCTVTVTRGHSLPIDQLRIIEQYAENEHITSMLPEFRHDDLLGKVDIPGFGIVYRWQRIWSQLLYMYSTTQRKHGALINPPYQAICLTDYIRADGTNMNGQLIYPSPHIVPMDENPKVKPCPIDVSAYAVINGHREYAIVDIEAMFNHAKISGAKIRSIQPEPANGCVHLNLEKAWP
jgi:hypothetical protein